MKLDDIASILRENLINHEVDFWQMVCEEAKQERLLRMVNGWQALFPYKLFFSPALLKKRVECSLCGKIRNPWSGLSPCFGPSVRRS
jgi:hypothetical protein